MVEQLERRYGTRPARLLADTHYATRQDLVALGGKGVEIYVPPAPVRRTATAASAGGRAHPLRCGTGGRGWRARKGKRSIAAA